MKDEVMIKDRSEDYQQGHRDGYIKGYSDKKSLVSKARKEERDKYAEALRTMEISALYPFNLFADLVDEKDLECIYSLSTINDALGKYLTDRERRVLEMKYRDQLTLEEIGERFNVTRERVRQVLAKAERKIRHPQVLLAIRVVPLKDYVDLVKERDELLTKIAILTDHMEAEKGKEAADIEREINLGKDIAELDLTVRAYNCLRRHGVKTIEDLAEMTIDDLYHVRNLGSKSRTEVIEKLKGIGITLKED